MHIHHFPSRKIQIGLAAAVILSANALALIQMARIDLESQLVEMGYLSEEGEEAEIYIIPPRKPDFSARRLNGQA